jgi:transcriptional regulator with XRE-family HTH domain
MSDKFGDRIRLHRLIKKMTRADFGKMLGVSEQAIGLYERSERQPTFEKLKEMADFFGVTIDYLLGHAPLKDAEKFLTMLDLTDSEILQKCTLMLDGRPLTVEEAKWFISMVRSHRNLVDPK